MAGSSDSEGESGVESRGKMVKRHKKELLAAQKAQKALGKKRADEGAALVAEVNARHAAELAALDAGPAGEAAAAPAAHLSEPPAVAGVASATAALAAAALSEPASAASDAGGKARALRRRMSAQRSTSAHTPACLDPATGAPADAATSRNAEAVQGTAAPGEAGKGGGTLPCSRSAAALAFALHAADALTLLRATGGARAAHRGGEEQHGRQLARD